MKKNALLLVVVMVLPALAITLFNPFPAPSAAAEKVITLKMVSAFPKTSGTYGETGQMIVAKIKERSNGRLIFNWIGASEAISRKDQPVAVKNGVIDVLYTPMSFYEQSLPVVSVSNLSRFTPMEERENGVYDYWVKAHEKMNVRYLSAAHSPGNYYLFLKFDVKDPKTDFKGKSMRGNNTFNPFLKALGAVPKVVGNREVYGALDSGVVQGAGSVPDNVSEHKTYEVISYWITHGFYRVTTALLMNLNTWNNLPNDLQDVVLQVTKELEAQRYKAMRDMDEIYFKEFKEKGIQPITFSEADAKWYVDLAYESKWEDAKGKIDQKDFAEIRALLEPKM